MPALDVPQCLVVYSSSLHQKDGRQLAARARCCLKYAAQCPPSSRLFFRYPKTGTYKYSHPTIVTKSLCHASTMRFSPMSYKNMRQRAGSRRFRPFPPPPCLPISAARVDPDSCQVLNILLRHCQLPTPTCSTVYRERGSTLAASLRPKGP
ncbi:uncharacterized protein UV8b_02899 [Ustilaginoidea virens]|uniref:Uncharacterized protein n=1 Tax=Ustilaginoidea virens TaxID=1159556 RepID=A0A8E5HNP3_USTVR|nr:uncharacterized protein UV8b_02899 [Ustilaginoidea virens]QUC18658.1 hypothetical protein UV8b_02899 [Ustilaginoidea virens]